jgi:hypothetical protein
MLSPVGFILSLSHAKFLEAIALEAIALNVGAAAVLAVSRYHGDYTSCRPLPGLLNNALV